MLKLAFGDPETSQHQAELLRKMHEGVKGVTSDGTPYEAMNPKLLLWVWATLVDVSVRMYERAVRPLRDDERERYYEEQKEIAYACGVPDGGCPATYADFERYVSDVIEHELRITPTARLVAAAGNRPPFPRPFDRIAGAAVDLFTAGLLPVAFREGLGYRWGPGREAIFRALLAASRAASSVVPRPLRHMPNTYLIKRKTPLGLFAGRAVTAPPR